MNELFRACDLDTLINLISKQGYYIAFYLQKSYPDFPKNYPS